jgi:predicted ATPase/class 3 adenylate cyclase
VAVRGDLPSGTVTFLFTDVEGSTKLLHELGAEHYADALAEHRRVVRGAFNRHGGVEVDTQGDAFFVAFPTAPGALQAAQEALDGLASGRIRVRIGIHTGTAHITEEGYVGDDVHRTARIAAAAHGGQVLVSAATALLVDTDRLRELGEHRLKDFDTAVPLYQLGEGDFPPLKTISNTNLPRPASSFVGRAREVEEIGELLQDGARLLTLTGPGGTGKTRLALEAASELVGEFKAGVFWVGLAALRDPSLVTDTIAYALGAKDGPQEHIGDREVLLLLDNLEQVVEAAPELAALVEQCPNLRLLVTSRELLRVRGERAYRVLPLAESEAVALFCERSGLAVDDTVADLCRALDNLPLAIELAAARGGVMSPRQIRERLLGRLDLLKGGRDADPRQQTLRATMEWSYELLSSREQQLFARLAVFRGGCTLEAAEDVADADLDTLQSLVEKSLLRHTDVRFWMLETIRAYAAERLEESGEAYELQQRHAHHFLALAEEAEPNLIEYSREWLDRLEREHENLRAALDRLGASGESELVLRLAGALSRFWDEKGHLAEGRRRLEGALRTDKRPTAARAKALNGAADMAVSLGDATTATLRAEEGLALHRTLGDAWGAAESGFLLGLAVADDDDFARARELFDESARQFRELGDQQYALVGTRMLAWMCYRLGDRERGRALHEDNLRQARALGNEHIEASTLGALAMIAVDQGRVGDAVSMLKESHRIHRNLGDPVGVGRGLSRVARVLASVGNAGTAARLLSSSEALHEELGASMRPWLAQMNEETLITVRAQLDEAAFAEAWEHGRALTADEALALALDSLGARYAAP